MYTPNYKEGSIVNLMSSIGNVFGKRSRYRELKILASRKIRKSKNIVLIVLDGIGHEYIMRKGKGTAFQEYLRGKMTSVFPSTTASAITTFATCTAPQMIKDTDFTNATSQGSKRLAYTTLTGFFSQIKKAINTNKKKKYIHAYWPFFDSISHELGIGSRETEEHFLELDRKLRAFIERIRGTDTTLIITADHGLIDSTKSKRIRVEDHPKMKECLTLPICGEGRAAYCYVHPSKARQFESYVKKRLKRQCRLFKSETLVKKDFFGLGKPNPKLFDRIGDYVLIMKDNYIIRDSILDMEREFHIGNHGGVSRDEMLVPLIVIRC